MGHYVAQCPRKHEKEKKKKHHAHAVDAEEHKPKDEEFSFVSTLTRTITQGSNTWLIDSGASKHMTGFKNSLSKLIENDSSLQVVLGDDSKHAIKGVGEASLQIDLGNPLSIKDILFVQGLKKNLLSISALEDKVFRVAFVDGQVLLWPKNSSINKATVIGVREGGLYKLKGHQEQALVHNIVSSSELWHRRLAHLNYRALPVLSKMVTGLLEIQIDHDRVCKGCALGKNFKGSFTSSDSRSKGILDIIHFDVCGQMMVPSLGNFVYYVLFINDYSRKTWIYFLKAKDEVFNKFQEFKALVENLSERKIKVLRSDNGGEYTSKEFKEFCQVGIKRELTTPYNPQHNEVAERKNRSIIEAAKANLHSSAETDRDQLGCNI
jgi:transposase InsO family protein